VSQDMGASDEENDETFHTVTRRLYLFRPMGGTKRRCKMLQYIASIWTGSPAVIDFRHDLLNEM